MPGDKAELIKIIEDINVEDLWKKPVIDFINVYEGGDPEFFSLINSVISLLCEMSDLNIKAEGYEALKSFQSDYALSVDSLRSKYKKVTEDKYSNQGYPVE